MEELVRTIDPTLIPYTRALLSSEDIECFVFDVNMSILEGGIGAFPRRIMVLSEDLARARMILRQNGVDPYMGEDWP